MNTTIVIDSGSHSTRAGIAGGITPQVDFPTIVGHRHWPQGAYEPNGPVLDLIGRDAIENKNGYKLFYNRPIHGGHVVDWDDMEKVWWHAFQNLKLERELSQCQILLTETSKQCSRKDTEKMAEIMFELFEVPAFFLADQAPLSLISMGRSTGIVVDSGDSFSRVIPVYEGHVLRHSIRRWPPTGGREVSFILQELLQERGFTFTSESDHKILEVIKENLCQINLEGKKLPPFSYTLPDGQVIELDDKIIRCPEIIFQKSATNPNFPFPGIQVCIHKTIKYCDVYLRKILYENVVLAGGNSMFPGFEKRLHAELNGLAPSTIKPKVMTTRVGKHCAWIGGSILASLSCFDKMKISKKEYHEIGPTIVERKCF